MSLSRLSPQYRILTKEEVNELLLKYKVVYRDLPKIKLTDPAVKMLNASEEDVIEITRKSLTAGESKYYRLVVK
ncbi:DNA-directed RNA polymerase subunit H [Candidatus Parvarchaeota archaeon]|nr:DNA-directed RNA polymerase subunit H [Candidatus Parvarchaeota archaeon]